MKKTKKARKILTLMLVMSILVSLFSFASAYEFNVKGKTNYSFVGKIVDLVNKARAEAGIAPLVYNGQSQEFTDNRAAELFFQFAHEHANGESINVNQKTGEVIPVGENILMNYSNENILKPEDVFNQWMNSPGHRANILDPDYKAITIGGWIKEKVEGQPVSGALFGFVQNFFLRAPEHPSEKPSEPETLNVTTTIRTDDAKSTFDITGSRELDNSTPETQLKIHANANPHDPNVADNDFGGGLSVVNSSLHFESKDPSIALVDANGNISRVGNGKTVVLIKDAQNKVIGEFEVTVKGVEAPVNPDEPGTPDKPDEPGTPDKPDEPGTPDNPDEPGTPDNPDEPGTPDKPDEPGTPDKPDEPGTPDNPDEPGTPDNPDEPGTPDNPDEPGTPDTPDEPGTPDKPDEPSTPDNPDEPGTPDNPDEPGTPDNPDEPGTPDNPDEPSTPDNPDEPGTPDNPDEPGTPDTPDEPDTPETPDEPVTHSESATINFHVVRSSYRYLVDNVNEVKILPIEEPMTAVKPDTFFYVRNTDGSYLAFDTAIAPNMEMKATFARPEERMMVMKADLYDKKTGDLMNNVYPSLLSGFVAGFEDGTAYSVGADGLWYKLAAQHSVTGGLAFMVRPGATVVVVK